ncbi:aspartyl protease APCB1-like [Carya illinoinensis]|uniref:aspartyl protease APCB1-like n=1 Tax=Carya illinoinensis TaxID=32201 RepID=UPI001C728CD5|nr:aspartyl protease APCB1-like [Carya illinoinensis]
MALPEEVYASGGSNIVTGAQPSWILHCFRRFWERVSYRRFSIVFGGIYNVTLNIGQPSKPYFLDPDTGGDLIWLQCDTPCVQCIEVKKELTGREALDDKTLPLCWRGRMPFQSLQDVRKYFKPLALSFTNGGKAKIQLELPPDAYLIISISPAFILSIVLFHSLSEC